MRIVKCQLVSAGDWNYAHKPGVWEVSYYTLGMRKHSEVMYREMRKEQKCDVEELLILGPLGPAAFLSLASGRHPVALQHSFHPGQPTGASVTCSLRK